MKNYRVKITKEAISDMEGLYRYIAEVLHSPENALKQYDRIADAILSLEKMPDRFGLFESEPEHSLKIHKMVIDNFIVCYMIDTETVTVTDILYGASDIHTKLQLRHL